MPLRRIRPEDKSQEWRPKKSVRLYLDDLDEILAVMRQVDNDVQIRTAELVGTISSAEELKEASPGSLEPLELTAGSKAGTVVGTSAGPEPHVVTTSEERTISVRLFLPVAVRITPRDDLHLVGAGQAIHDLLAARQTAAGGGALRGSTTTGSSLFWPVQLGIMTFGTLAIMLVMSETLNFRSTPSTGTLLGAGVVAALVFAGYLAYSLFLGRNPLPSATIVLAYRADAPTWWERHRTAVVISLITNVVVAAVFFFLGLWLP